MEPLKPPKPPTKPDKKLELDTCSDLTKLPVAYIYHIKPPTQPGDYTIDRITTVTGPRPLFIRLLLSYTRRNLYLHALTSKLEGRK